jgi:hypothetical protein
MPYYSDEDAGSIAFKPRGRGGWDSFFFFFLGVGLGDDSWRSNKANRAPISVH